MRDQIFDQMVVESLKVYQESMKEEAKGRKLLTADMLSEEVKQAMGIDILPVDIQNDILALSQKLVDFTLVVVDQREEAKGPPPFLMGPSSFSPSSPFIDCMKRFPSKELWRDSKNVMVDTGKTLGFGAVVPGFIPWIPVLSAGSGIANGVFGSLGYLGGCWTK